MPIEEASSMKDWLLGVATTFGISGVVAGIRTWAKTNRHEERLNDHKDLIEKVNDACTQTREQVAGVTGEIRAIRETTQTELGAIRQTTKAELESIHRSIRERDRRGGD